MINEYDIKDLQPSAEAIELYKVQRDSIVSLEEEPEVTFKFSHVDGMYSLCYDKQGTIFHPAAWSKVFVWKEKGNPFDVMELIN